MVLATLVSGYFVDARILFAEMGTEVTKLAFDHTD
jgi:hypothetical protein